MYYKSLSALISTDVFTRGHRHIYTRPPTYLHETTDIFTRGHRSQDPGIRAPGGGGVGGVLAHGLRNLASDSISARADVRFNALA